MTTEEVQKKLKKHRLLWGEFMEWMRHQTVGVYPDGSTDWYEEDVARFIRNKGRKDSVAEWD
jgi:hypothetical protein